MSSNQTNLPSPGKIDSQSSSLRQPEVIYLGPVGDNYKGEFDYYWRWGNNTRPYPPTVIQLGRVYNNRNHEMHGYKHNWSETDSAIEGSYPGGGQGIKPEGQYVVCLPQAPITPAKGQCPFLHRTYIGMQALKLMYVLLFGIQSVMIQ